METGQPSIFPTTTTPSKGMFGTRFPTTTAFIVGLSLFLLPFAELKCNDTTLATNTGLGIATGSRWKEIDPKNIFGNNTRDNTNLENNSKKPDPNVYALVAYVLGVLGLALTLINTRITITLASIAGVLSAGALIGLFLDLKNKVKTPGINNLRNPENPTDFNGSFSLDFTPWFYIAVVAFLAAAVFSWMRIKPSQNLGLVQ